MVLLNNIKLTRKEISELLDKRAGTDHERLVWVADAATTKAIASVAKWGNEPCFNETHGEARLKRFCPKCWAELSAEVEEEK